MKKAIVFILALALCLAAAACGKTEREEPAQTSPAQSGEEAQSTPEPSPEPEPAMDAEPEPEPDYSGTALEELAGKYRSVADAPLCRELLRRLVDGPVFAVDALALVQATDTDYGPLMQALEADGCGSLELALFEAFMLYRSNRVTVPGFDGGVTYRWPEIVIVHSTVDEYVLCLKELAHALERSEAYGKNDHLLVGDNRTGFTLTLPAGDLSGVRTVSGERPEGIDTGVALLMSGARYDFTRLPDGSLALCGESGTLELPQETAQALFDSVWDRLGTAYFDWYDARDLTSAELWFEDGLIDVITEEETLSRLEELLHGAVQVQTVSWDGTTQILTGTQTMQLTQTRWGVTLILYRADGTEARLRTLLTDPAAVCTDTMLLGECSGSLYTLLGLDELLDIYTNPNHAVG